MHQEPFNPVVQNREADKVVQEEKVRTGKPAAYVWHLAQALITPDSDLWKYEHMLACTHTHTHAQAHIPVNRQLCLQILTLQADSCTPI